MNWKEYEKLTHQYFKSRFPNSKITHDVKLTGKRSNTQRQIDVLIEEIICGYNIRIVIECKDWAVPLDVADVEQFVAKLDDIGVHKGVMVAKSGYTKSAKMLSKSYNNLQLHVLKFEELDEFQGFWGNPYRGCYGALVCPPNGWLLDSKVPSELLDDALCLLYPMELEVEQAFKERNIIVFNIPQLIFDLNDENALKQFLKMDEETIYSHDKKAKINYLDESTEQGDLKIRITEYPGSNYIETAGIANTGKFILFAYGVHTEFDKDEFLSHIKFIFQQILPIEIKGVDPRNSHDAWTSFLKGQYPDSKIVCFRHY
jgi:hypothetical protein